MSSEPSARQREAYASAAQAAVGVLAARHRGDANGAEALLGDLANREAGTLAFYTVAELAVRLAAESRDEPLDVLLRELSLHIARAADER